MFAKTFAPHRRLLVGTALAAVLSACSMAPVASTNVPLSATLSGAAEVPPNESAGTGKLEGSYDRNTNLLKWKLTYSGLSGPATMAHFHGPAMAGENAGVAVPFASAASPIVGEKTITAEQAAALLDGKWYANVHTAAHPGGEIRGQVLVVK